VQVRGILNGIDVVEWDPSSDPLLPANYNAQFPDGKQVCKKYLQRVSACRGCTSTPAPAAVVALSLLLCCERLCWTRQ
jgi:glycogen synthase